MIAPNSTGYPTLAVIQSMGLEAYAPELYQVGYCISNLLTERAPAYDTDDEAMWNYLSFQLGPQVFLDAHHALIENHRRAAYAFGYLRADPWLETHGRPN